MRGHPLGYGIHSNMTSTNTLDTQSLLDGLGQAVLIFDSTDKLIQFNVTAKNILGPDLKLIRAEGWKAAAALMDTRINDPTRGDYRSANRLRDHARDHGEIVRFQMFRAGEFLPCSIGVVVGADDQQHTIVSIETPDWTALTELVSHYLNEVRDAVEGTQGHATLIAQSLKLQKPNEGIDKLTHRIGGFTKLIEMHMHRLGNLTAMIERLEMIRTGQVRQLVAESVRRIDLYEFVGKFVSELNEHPIVDPESDSSALDHRHRLTIGIAPDVAILASPTYLMRVLRDVLRNAIMYSMKATPIYIKAHAIKRDHSIQIDVIDEGYGIRAGDNERVFMPFARSRQPQIIGEFGYGLSLFLCKYEIEAMNGRIWFTSEEGVGTTFSIKLPAWRENFSADGMSMLGTGLPGTSSSTH